MKKSLMAMAAMVAAGCAVVSSRRDYDDQARGHELRALNMGGLEASLKAQRATHPAPMPNDGRAVWIGDKVVLGAAAGGGVGTPQVGDTLDFFVPAGTKLFELAFVGDDCDTGALLAASIGYRPVSANDGALAANATYFQAAAALFQSPGRIECIFKPIKFEQDVFVSITITAAAAGIAGNPEIHMVSSGNAEGAK